MPVKLICQNCGKEFEVEPSKAKGRYYCSNQCRIEGRRKGKNKICPICGKSFYVRPSKYERKYCSKECSAKGQKNGEKVPCAYCGKVMYRPKGRLNKNNLQFCSSSCEGQYKKEAASQVRKCIICGNNFTTKISSPQKCCSVECAHELFRSRIGVLNPKFTSELINCTECGKEFYQKQYKLKGNKYGNFCSYDCSRKYLNRTFMQTEEIKQASRKRTLKMLSDGTISETNSLPQRLLDNILNGLNILYEREKTYDYFNVDNYLSDYNLIIEVQGDYWHCNPDIYYDEIYEMQFNRITKDKSKHTFIKEKYGIEILYLWECDIKNRPDICTKLIKKYIETKGQLENYNSFNYFINDAGQLELTDCPVLSYQEQNVSEYRDLVKKAS